MRALGLDLGSRRIGVAVSDADGRLATPVATVPRTRDRVATHRALAAEAAEWEAEVVVVGLPLSLDGSIGPAAQGVLDELDELRAAIGLPLVTHDERLTTVSAHRELRASGVRGKDRKDVVDRSAAAFMLQAWLDAGAPGIPPEEIVR